MIYRIKVTHPATAPRLRNHETASPAPLEKSGPSTGTKCNNYRIPDLWLSHDCSVLGFYSQPVPVVEKAIPPVVGQWPCDVAVTL